MSQYFDQVSLAAIANLSAGMVSVDGGLRDMILSLLLVRVGLKIFYNVHLKPNTEIQLFLISAIAWIVGNSLLRGHSWNPPYVFDDRVPEEPMEDPATSIKRIVTSVVSSLFRKLF
jgi:hypothetical protein